ncbi:hypothetical protein LCL97_13975 [Seohaeicola saemankumensis]|nr:hypothetical protein [Seohaeicola saemankumensis]MCA0871943.1 hypothetical protein [Seohaeicola saemankumensis]
MPVTPHLVSIDAIPMFGSNVSSQDRLWACHDAFVDEIGDDIIAGIVYDRSFARLKSGISEGMITHGQWVLHISLIMEGQISNGGVAQLLKNFPHLIEDCLEVLEFLALLDFLKQLQLAAGDLPSQVSRLRQKHGEGPTDISAIDVSWDGDDLAVKTIDNDFKLVFEDRADPQRWGCVPRDGYCDLLCRRAADYALDHIDQFAKIAANQ